MFSTYERMVGFRYLRARRQEGFVSLIAIVSLIGIMLGIATLIIVMAVMNGFREELFERVLGLNGHVTVWAVGAEPLHDFERLSDDIRRVPEVVRVTPVVRGQALIVRDGEASGALVKGLQRRDLLSRRIIVDNIVGGTVEDFGGGAGVVVGNRLARRMGVRAGDSITIVAPKGAAGPFGTMPRMKAFPVLATFDVGMYEYDNTYIYMPFDLAQTFFSRGSGASLIEVMVADPERATVIARGIAEAAGRGTSVFDWRRTNSCFVSALEVERNVMFLILTLIVMVAAFNILSSMIMLVKDKARDIAILRTIGSTKGAIMRIFFLVGTVIGVTGTLAGFVIGIVFSLNIESIRRWIETLADVELFQAEIYFLSQLPAKVDSGEVIAVVAMGLLLSVLAPLYPAWRAARQDPADALRYE